MLDQNPPHGLGGRSEEVLPAPPGLLRQEPQISFVDQHGWLQRYGSRLTPHVGTRDAMELGVDGSKEALGRGPIAGAGCREQLGHVDLGHVFPMRTVTYAVSGRPFTCR